MLYFVIKCIQVKSSYNTKINNLNHEIRRLQNKLKNSQIKFQEQAQFHSDKILINSEDLYTNQLPETFPSPQYDNLLKCKMSSCFDHSRCSITSGFPIYLYDPDSTSVTNEGYKIDESLKNDIKKVFESNAHFTKDPTIACVFFVLVGEALENEKVLQSTHVETLLIKPSKVINTTALHSLKYWYGDGRNHVLLNLAKNNLDVNAKNIFSSINTGRAILVQSTFYETQYRRNFDIIVPPILGPLNGDVWQQCPPMSPARRKYLMSFQGEARGG